MQKIRPYLVDEEIEIRAGEGAGRIQRLRV